MPTDPPDSLSSALTRNIRTLEERRARETAAAGCGDHVLHGQYAIRLPARGILRGMDARGLRDTAWQPEI